MNLLLLFGRGVAAALGLRVRGCVRASAAVVTRIGAGTDVVVDLVTATAAVSDVGSGSAERVAMSGQALPVTTITATARVCT